MGVNCLPDLMDPSLLRVSEVATRLRLSEETVRRWLRRGRLHGVMFGSNKAGWRVPLAEVERVEREGVLDDEEEEVAA